MEQLRSFLDYIRLNRNASVHTVAAYQSDLSQFVSFAGERTGKRERLHPKHIDLELIRAFLAKLGWVETRDWVVAA